MRHCNLLASGRSLITEISVLGTHISVATEGRKQTLVSSNRFCPNIADMDYCNCWRCGYTGKEDKDVLREF